MLASVGMLFGGGWKFTVKQSRETLPLLAKKHIN